MAELTMGYNKCLKDYEKLLWEQHSSILVSAWCLCHVSIPFCINPFALRKAKIAYNFALSECNRVKLLDAFLFVIVKVEKVGRGFLVCRQVVFYREIKKDVC